MACACSPSSPAVWAPALHSRPRCALRAARRSWCTRRTASWRRRARRAAARCCPWWPPRRARPSGASRRRRARLGRPHYNVKALPGELPCGELPHSALERAPAIESPSGAHMHAAREPQGQRCTGEAPALHVFLLGRPQRTEQSPRRAGAALGGARAARDAPARGDPAARHAAGRARARAGHRAQPVLLLALLLQGRQPLLGAPLSWPLGTRLISRVWLGLVPPLELHVLPPPPPPQNNGCSVQTSVDVPAHAPLTAICSPACNLRHLLCGTLTFITCALL